MQRFVFFITLYMFLSLPSITFSQDFNDGLSAIENGDYEEAAKIFLVAAEKGDKHAQHCLGVLFDKGLGVKQNHKESFKWLDMAAKQGLSQAKFDLGILIYHNKGVPENYIDK